MDISQKRDEASRVLGAQFLQQLSDDIATVLNTSDVAISDKNTLRKARKIIESYADDLHGH